MGVHFKKTYYDESEAACVQDALDGTDYVTKVKELLAGDFGEVFLTASGSAAFDLLFCALEFKPGDEVIIPSFTFPSVANTALRAGLVPVFAEIDKDTKALAIEDVRKKMTARTCCIVTTHYGGSSVDMDELKKQSGDVMLIEDAALSYGARYKDKPLGTIGDAGIFSFHRTKNISSEQGGMLALSRNLANKLEQKLQRVYDIGTDKADYLTGKVHEYTWRQIGMNAVMPNTSAAILYAQLRKADEIIEKQQRISQFYEMHLSPLAVKYGFELPRIPAYNADNYHLYYVMFQEYEERERVRKKLFKSGVEAFFHYMPLHASEMGQQLGYAPEDLPVTQSVSSCLLRLPICAAMTEADCAYVVSKIQVSLC